MVARLLLCGCHRVPNGCLYIAFANARFNWLLGHCFVVKLFLEWLFVQYLFRVVARAVMQLPGGC